MPALQLYGVDANVDEQLCTARRGQRYRVSGLKHHIHRAVRSEDRAAKGRAQRFAQTFVAFEHFMVDFVAVEDAGALPLKGMEKARLPRARAAGDADDCFPIVRGFRMEARGLFEAVSDSKAKSFTVRISERKVAFFYPGDLDYRGEN